MDNNKPKYLPFGASALHATDPVRAINDALSTRANFVRNYLENPYANDLDPVLRHHLGLTNLPAKKGK